MTWIAWLAVIVVLFIAGRYYYAWNRRRRRGMGAGPDSRVDLLKPENAGIVAYLKGAPFASPPSERLESDSTALSRQLGDTVKRCTEPETLEVLWEEWNGSLPADCRSIVYGRPVLVHPKTGILFAVAAGMHCWAVRLPPDEAEAEQERISGEYFESDWADTVAAFGSGWLPLGNRELCRAAYDHAAIEATSREPPPRVQRRAESREPGRVAIREDPCSEESIRALAAGLSSLRGTEALEKLRDHYHRYACADFMDIDRFEEIAVDALTGPDEVRHGSTE